MKRFLLVRVLTVLGFFGIAFAQRNTPAACDRECLRGIRDAISGRHARAQSESVAFGGERPLHGKHQDHAAW